MKARHRASRAGPRTRKRNQRPSSPFPSRTQRQERRHPATPSGGPPARHRPRSARSPGTASPAHGRVDPVGHRQTTGKDSRRLEATPEHRHRPQPAATIGPTCPERFSPSLCERTPRYGPQRGRHLPPEAAASPGGAGARRRWPATRHCHRRSTPTPRSNTAAPRPSAGGRPPAPPAGRLWRRRWRQQGQRGGGAWRAAKRASVVHAPIQARHRCQWRLGNLRGPSFSALGRERAKC
mmetsp:Transcript_4763/g.17997  ORF Transcript_4763/g.17997 Transcript_4763/m.17997 type:complete len:237 (-) Transcript_4763:5-715(-)